MSQNYSTTLNTRPFMYNETKLIVTLMVSGLSETEIKNKVLQDNIFQLTSLDRAGRFYREIMKRIDNLDEYLIERFINADSLTSRALLLYAILKKDTLFFEWMKEVIFDKFLIMERTLSKQETDYFFELKSEQSSTVANWTPSTKKILRDSYHQVLKDAGMLVELEGYAYLQPLVIELQVENYLIEYKEKQVVEVMLGESLE
ncbi:Putative inner membrane protein [Carnobacterium iners]|uniref:Putative inner membrane protein n=1 Tax=Carnobacterium iners TaxID=1073423 RepID=A0A1X7MNW8_9LACT|nr:DUF1819 family protein [Carnobacterium iners]SEL23342.1 Putative inner membrane protein [Carnobacterium iners]SMH26314.1 Putative inner membrane protein [Carnobacterium iners]